jgi:hypothetical protein
VIPKVIVSNPTSAAIKATGTAASSKGSTTVGKLIAVNVLRLNLVSNRAVPKYRIKIEGTLASSSDDEGKAFASRVAR